MATNNTNFNIKNGLTVADTEVITPGGRVIVSNTDVLNKTNAAFTQANTANASALAAFSKANSATILAQAAFNQANTGGGGGTSLPSQSGHSGEYLTTDGSNLSWSAVSGGGGGLTPWSAGQLSSVEINKSPSTRWRNLGNADQISYCASTYFDGLTPTKLEISGTCYQLNSANNLFITAPRDQYGPDMNNMWNQMWLVFSSGSDVNFANTTLGQSILGLTVGSTVNAKVKWIRTPWSPDIFCVPLTVTVAPCDLFAKVSANSNPSYYFNFSIADSPYNYACSCNCLTPQYTNTYNPYTEISNSNSYYLKPGQKIIIGFCNPLVSSYSKSINCGCNPYDWNFGAWDYTCGSQYRTNWQYVFNVGDATNNWWLDYNWNGVAEMTGGICGGTVARIETPSLVNQILTYNGNIGADNGCTNFGTVSLYNSTSNNIILTADDITSTFTTSNTIQAYVGTNFAAALTVGNALKVTENPLTANTFIDGEVYKTLNYQSLGQITGTYASTASLVPRMGATPICVSNQQNSIYCNSVGNCGCSVYTMCSADGGSTTTCITNNLNNVKNIVFAPYNITGGCFTILNLSNNAISNLTTGTPVQLQYTNKYNGTLTNWTVNFTVNTLYTNNQYCFGDNVWGCYCSNSSWCNARLNFVSAYKNGNIQSNYYPTDSCNWYAGYFTKFNLFYPGQALAVNVASTGTVTTSNHLNIDNTEYLISSIDSTNNTIILSSEYDSSINLIGSVATTNTYYSLYSTICDIDTKLINAGLCNIITCRSIGTGFVPPTYVLKSDGQCPSNLTWNTLTLQDALCAGSTSGCCIYLYACCDSYSTSPTRGTCCATSWQGGMFQTCGGLGVAKGIWANHVWANTALESRIVCTTNSCVTNNAYICNVIGNSICIPKVETKASDSDWTSVAFLSLGKTNPPVDSVTSCNIINQNGATIGNSTTIPPGATGYSICVNNNCYLKICNSNNINVFNGDFTVETWLQNPCNWPYWGYNLWSASNSCAMVCWSQQMCTKINNTWQGSGVNCGCIYNAFWGYNGLNGTGWNHWAFSRSGGTLYYFLNGQLLGSSAGSTTNDSAAPAFYCIGAPSGLTASGCVLLYNFRVTAGCGRYTSAFTPSLSPYGTATLAEYANTSNSAIDVYGGIKMTNMCYVPEDTYSSGGYLYIDNGALKYKGSGGTVTTLGSA